MWLAINQMLSGDHIGQNASIMYQIKGIQNALIKKQATDQDE